MTTFAGGSVAADQVGGSSAPARAPSPGPLSSQPVWLCLWPARASDFSSLERSWGEDR